MKLNQLKKHLKKVATLFACATLVLSQVLPTTAANVANPQESAEYVSYDMSIGGTQVFHVTDENGEESIITVTELLSTSRVANGTYQIEHTKSGYWKAGFKISVTSNCITSVYGKYNNTIIGNISNDTLRLDSSKQATYQFDYQFLFSKTTGVRCVIENDNLKIYAL